VLLGRGELEPVKIFSKYDFGERSNMVMFI